MRLARPFALLILAGLAGPAASFGQSQAETRPGSAADYLKEPGADATKPARPEPTGPKGTLRNPDFPPGGPADAPAPRRVLGQDKGHLAIVGADGKVEWEAPVRHNAHDLQVLPNGNILVGTDAKTVVEMTPDKQIAWKYVAQPAAGNTGRVEIHAFQRLPDGRTMVAESGNRRIVEVDNAGQVVKVVPLLVEHPDPHRDTRRARKLDNGHYLVCHEGDGTVREYDDAGTVVWSYKLDLAGRPRTDGHAGHGVEVYNALRKPDGNTLIAGGNNNRVFEVDPAGKVVWSVDHDELPGIELRWVTSLFLMPNGNVLFGNTHAGPENPQLIEVTRDKKVAWKFHDFTNFGNDLASAVVLRQRAAEGVIR